MRATADWRSARTGRNRGDRERELPGTPPTRRNWSRNWPANAAPCVTQLRTVTISTSWDDDAPAEFRTGDSADPKSTQSLELPRNSIGCGANCMLKGAAANTCDEREACMQCINNVPRAASRRAAAAA